MKIPVVFLGTGQAIPTAKRNHTSILLKYKDETMLVDCGEGTQRQIRKAKINPCKLTRLLITHWHGDHILGIPGLLQTLALNNYNKTLHIYGPKRTKKFMNLIMSLFVKKGKIKYEIKEITKGKVFETPDLIVEALPMRHGAPCLAYSIKEKDKIRINKKKLKKLNLPQTPLIQKLKLGKDIKIKGKKISGKNLTYSEPGKKISFIFDTIINPNTYKLAKDSDLLICESTFLANSEKGEQLAKEYKHLTAKQAAGIAKKAKAKKLVLAHISQRYENKEELILDEAKKIFKNVHIPEDLDKIEV
ncbi:MAG: ribonuclease Z [Candidatus Thorarchaeota archaeon]|jgi:ribonuclease Z